jgi:hypothetical protein
VVKKGRSDNIRPHIIGERCKFNDRSAVGILERQLLLTSRSGRISLSDETCRMLGFGIPLSYGVRYSAVVAVVIVPGIVPMPHHG